MNERNSHPKAVLEHDDTVGFLTKHFKDSYGLGQQFHKLSKNYDN